MWNRELSRAVCAVSGSVGKGNIQPHLHSTGGIEQLNIELAFHMGTDLPSLCTLVLYKAFSVCFLLVIQNSCDRS